MPRLSARPRPTCSRAPSRGRAGTGAGADGASRADLAAGQAQPAPVGGGPPGARPRPRPAAHPRRRAPLGRGQSHGGRGTTTSPRHRTPATPVSIRTGTATGSRSRFAFGGDVHFPAGTNLGDRLAADPSDALGPTVPALLSGVDLSMVNLESALTDGSCPDPQPKQYVFYAPTSAVSAFQGAGVTLITEANNHGEDCGPAGPADGARRPGPDRVHHPGHRPERGAGLHPVHDDDPRGAHRDHRRHPGHRLRPADGVDGDRARSPAWRPPTT